MSDHALHFDPDCEECVYLARPTVVRVPAAPVTDAGLREADSMFSGHERSTESLATANLRDALDHWLRNGSSIEAADDLRTAAAEWLAGEEER